jgi:hypothetical protein
MIDKSPGAAQQRPLELTPLPHTLPDRRDIQIESHAGRLTEARAE